MARRPQLCRAADALVHMLTDVCNERQITAEQLESVSGVSRHSWREMRDGRSNPKLSSVRAIAAALGYELKLHPMGRTKR